MQSPNIHGEPDPESMDRKKNESDYEWAQRLKIIREDNEQRERTARFFIELPYFGRLRDYVPLMEYLDRSVQLRFHNEALRFEAKLERDYDKHFQGNAPPVRSAEELMEAGTFTVQLEVLAAAMRCTTWEAASALANVVAAFGHGARVATDIGRDGTWHDVRKVDLRPLSPSPHAPLKYGIRRTPEDADSRVPVTLPISAQGSGPFGGHAASPVVQQTGPVCRLCGGMGKHNTFCSHYPESLSLMPDGMVAEPMVVDRMPD